jgi:glucose/arabinose dehydrogenase
MKKRTLLWVLFLGIALVLFGLYKKYPVNLPLFLKDRVKDSLQTSLDELKLPHGFKLSVYAQGIEDARSLTLSPTGTLFVGNRSGKYVYALVDKDGDFKVDLKYKIYKSENMPNGVAFHKGDLYIAEVNRILKFTNIESKLENPGKPEVIYDKYPTEEHHGWKYIAFGPDEKLYVPVGAPCNICESKDSIFNTITRINADGTGLEIVCKGVRNSVGFDWNPMDSTFWFTDNGRDLMGDNVPECELNHHLSKDDHFGYPYCHQGDVSDPEFGKKAACEKFKPPTQKLGPHTAPLGMEFYSGNMFPKEYDNAIFIARHGSWNRSKKIGYDIVTINIDEHGKSSGIKPFISGWLDDVQGDVSGRPVDFETMKDGSMLISDDFANAVYRLSYK